MLLGGDLPAQRRFLEEHPELLSYSSLAQLQRTLTLMQQKDVTLEAPVTFDLNLEVRGSWDRLWLLLFDALHRGGGVQAIREAYVHWHGGFALDIPDWLGPLIERDRALKRTGHSSQTAHQRVALWEGAIARLQRESTGSAPEIQAEIYVRTQEAYEDAYGLNKPELQQKELACIQFSLNIYNETRYPYAWARRQSLLGALYLRRLQGDRAEQIEQAIACLQATLRVFTERDFPLEWAQTHNYLGLAYRDRLQGNKEENQEQGILFFEAALRVLSERAAPIDWAMVQANLGVLYLERVRERKEQNLRQAIAYLRAALRVFTRETSPVEWAMSQMELGNALVLYSGGDTGEKRQQAIACFQEALRVYTERDFPLEWAMTQTNLGNIYSHQTGAVGENLVKDLEQAIAFYQASLHVYTEQDFPVEWARSQLDLGTVYVLRQQGDARENGRQAIACFQTALRIYTRRAFPEMHRLTAQNLVTCASMNELWELTHAAAVNAREAEEDLLALTAGVKEIDTLLRQRRDTVLFDAFALTRLGRYAEAVESIERGQAYGLAAARLLNAADPQRISDPLRRATYLQRRSALQEAQAAVQSATTLRPDRTEWLARTATLRQARAAFDAAVAAIRAAGDPADFLSDTFSAQTLLHILAAKPVGHALIYLLVTPWGGLALGVLNPPPGTSPRFDVLDLPALTRKIFYEREIENEGSYLRMLFEHRLSSRALGQSLDWLVQAGLRQLSDWLQTENISSLTLIPCGILDAFPLLAVPLEVTDGAGVTLADRYVASVAPCARALLDSVPTLGQRRGVVALGNPYPTHQPLAWGEAEALTLAYLGENAERVFVQYEADRAHLLNALHTAKVVEVSCHAVAADDYLQSHLLLANGERFLLADALNGAVADMHGLRVLILSACQTAILSLQGALSEVRSLAGGMLQAGARAVLAALWPVDDKATYLLMVRFAQEWFPHMETEPPAAALARAQHWLRTVTNHQLHIWQTTEPLSKIIARTRAFAETAIPTGDADFLPARGTFSPTTGEQNAPAFHQRYTEEDAQEIVQAVVLGWTSENDPERCPYADPYYWSGFQLYGW
jgi:CHAT domain-containing protein